MRLWSIHPSYLDSNGIVALWREGLLARKVLRGETRGYTNHPQLTRFKEAQAPLSAIDAYLAEVAREATVRGYSFDISKIDASSINQKLTVTTEQITYEREHLVQKLLTRDPERLLLLDAVVVPHPLFTVTEGEFVSWERR